MGRVPSFSVVMTAEVNMRRVDGADGIHFISFVNIIFSLSLFLSLNSFPSLITIITTLEGPKEKKKCRGGKEKKIIIIIIINMKVK